MLTGRKIGKGEHGFSLLELIVVVTVILILAGVLVPLSVNAISSVKLHYVAVDLTGLIQSARIQAVRKNKFYSLAQTQLTGGSTGYFVDLSAPPHTGLLATGDPLLSVGSATVFAGTGSGAPLESNFVASLNFAMNPGLPTMDARGLPCVIAVSDLTCTETPGLGFVLFVSNQGAFGNTNWASVVVTPSGRVQVWSYNGGANANWVQM
jgi:prepilin-type N-terminal cleavage/methylation domain-containing protein